MYIDLFAGCGGLSLGLHKAGWTGLFAVEKNKDAFSTLQQNLIVNRRHFQWPGWLPQTNLDINELLKNYEEELIELRGQVQLLVGGPPCQGFSMAGKRTGNDIRNRLYNSYIKFVEIVEPEMLFFENVHGFTVGFKRKYKGKPTKGEPYSQKLIKRLRKLGYDVAHEVIMMSDYGVPQKRKRFILFATKRGKAKIFFDRLSQRKDEFLLDKNITLPVSVSEAIGDLERRHGQVQSVDSPRFMNGLYGEVLSEYQSLMRAEINVNAVPDSHRFAKPKQETIDLFERLMNVSDEAIRITPKMGLVEGLKKRGVTPLKRNCVCPTITSIPDDFIHYSEPRILTVRESARIQSFPDDYVFLGKYTTGGDRRKYDVPRYTQVANAVPPLFAELVGLVLQEMVNDE
ncbi:MAG: DNA cytosine methyltransferase [Paenibacillaceae bacterium]|nr:DNA cytosine methyltransferase [Paenibacillaceae bacterium]